MLIKHASVPLALALAAGSARAQGSFSGPTTIPTGQRPGGMVLVDIDLDGDNDLATVNQDSGSVVVLPNTGNGTFGTGTCNDVDFNNNGLFPEDADVADFFRVLGGGCVQLSMGRR